MNRETAIQNIKEQISCRDYLEKGRISGLCCPFCDSGHGKNGTGAVKYFPDTNTWYCYGCKKGGDVISLYQKTVGCTFNEAITALSDQIGITIDSYTPGNDSHRKNGLTERSTTREKGSGKVKTLGNEKASNIASETLTETPVNYMEYYKLCRDRLNTPEALSYLKSRGISIETAQYYWIGYDPAADPAGAPGAGDDERKAHPCPRIIIPASYDFYTARRIDDEKTFKYANSKGSSPTIFNRNALQRQDVREVFITEGSLDALSILEAGAAAVGLNSASNVDILLNRLEKYGTEAILVIAMDNDDKGREAAEKLREGLQRINIPFIVENICGEYKDPNEALVNDRDAFIKAVETARRKTAYRPDNTLQYIEKHMDRDISRFKDEKLTGFFNLDKASGGLYAGLYALAAITSLGKTSFALQLADQLAEAGNDILYFSLEQSRLELVTKSLSRITAQIDKRTAVTSLQIRKGYRPEQVNAALTKYKETVGDRVNIIEGNFRCNAQFITKYIRDYVKRNKTRPVVFIDYLQILQPDDDGKKGSSLRETVDHTVTELKRISRDLDLTVFIISSVNRSNYLTPIDNESLKESGGIEYTCDVVWGLQLQCMNDPIFSKEKQIAEKRDIVKRGKAETPRKMELCCLKNRYGISNFSCYFLYDCVHDLFEEDRIGPSSYTGTTSARR